MLKIRLVLQLPGSEKRRVKIDRDVFVIGRHEHCDRTIVDPRLSRRHCEFNVSGSRVTLKDLKSRNGTSVNSKRLQPGESRRLYHDDRLQIGSLQFRISIRDPETLQPHLREPSQEPLLDPEMSAMDELLGQLEQLGLETDVDSIGTDMPTRSFSKPSLAVQSAATVPPATVAPPTVPPATVAPATHSPPADGAGDHDLARDPESKRAIGAEDKIGPDAGDSDQSNGGKNYQKLPQHLRSGTAKNSRQAAKQALKNLFEGRG